MRQVSHWIIADPCPQCGGALITDGRKVWCDPIDGCRYGLDSERWLADVGRAETDSGEWAEADNKGWIRAET